jgi:SAM-dependent methyltransferase
VNQVQQKIDHHFDASAQYWKDLYDQGSLEGAIHRRRRALALGWVETLGLPGGAPALEVGCGAGLLAIDLAGAGLTMRCIDSSAEMVGLASAEAARSDVAERVTVEVGDVHALGFDAGAFQLVVALGVVPFLHDPAHALAEMARVLSPGGWALFSSDNRFRLNRVLDPRYTPFPGRQALRRRLTNRGVMAPAEVPGNYFSRRTVSWLVVDAGLMVMRCVTFGFGPFTFMGRRVLAEPRAVAVDDWLQIRADRGAPVLGSMGAQHLILARKA